MYNMYHDYDNQTVEIKSGGHKEEYNMDKGMMFVNYDYFDSK